ncbi:sensor histidine kinase [uncultured Jatrophihabitans sp.]|uniref:sensor histidine kinase n=1 Tax=uncultured Jatrophihabitans sp. TaxID=1610747 RepID=UPI0035C9ABED
MRRRILLLVVGMTVLVVLAFAIPLVVFIRNNARDDAISDLQREAGDVARAVGQYGATALPAYLKGLPNAASVQLPSGSVVGTPPPGTPANLPALSDGLSGGVSRPGLGGPPNPSPTSYAGGTLVSLRVGFFRSAEDDAYVVRVYATDDEITSGATTPLLLLAGASVVLILIGIALGELLTRRIVRPLAETAATAQQLSSGDTTARAPTDGPVEVADVGRALNRLADRIDELIAEERETVADMSHRLRTPLTALRLDAEALDEPAEAERIGGHVTVLERMLTAVIHAARRPQREGRIPASDATEVVGGRVAFWSALTEDQGRVATVDLPADPLPVRAGAEDLAVVVDALLENVVAHTPEGTAFSVTLAPSEHGARLVVADDGPGLPSGEPIRGRSDRGSSGLGLDIARRSAVASGGAMTLGASPSGGAMITLDFGRP